MYDPDKVVEAFSDYRDEAQGRPRRWRRQRTPRSHPYVSQRNFDVHRALIAEHIPATGTVLEIGPGGAANYTRILAQRGRRVIAGDISPRQLQDLQANIAGTRAEPLVSVLEMDVTQIPLGDGSVDAVVCIGGVLSYVFDAAPVAVAEICRVVKTGGRVVVSVMTPAWITSPQMGYRDVLTQERYEELVATNDVTGAGLDASDHRYRCYTSDGLVNLLETGGLRVVDCLASHLDGVAADVDLSEYMEACRAERARDTTRGYLIAVAERVDTAE